MPQRKTSSLHFHRWSAPNVRYFITVCTVGRRPGLTAPNMRELLLQAVMNSDALDDTLTFAFTVMPDHVHWMLQLGNRLSLGSVLGRLKSHTRLELARVGHHWQRDFFERRLREPESIQDYSRYIFMNPYRAGLLSLGATWAGWWCPRPEQMEFLTQLNPDGSVPREWMGDEDEIQVGRD